MRHMIAEEDSFSRMDIGVTQYQGSSGKISGVHYVPIPRIHAYQEEDWYQTLPYRVQGQLFKNPFAESELNVERLLKLPVQHPGLVDCLLLTHHGYRPNLPVQFDLVDSLVDLEGMLHVISQQHRAQGYYG